MRIHSTKDGKLLFNCKNLFDDKITNVKVSNNLNYIMGTSIEGTSIKIFDTRMQKVLISLMDDKYDILLIEIIIYFYYFFF